MNKNEKFTNCVSISDRRIGKFAAFISSRSPFGDILIMFNKWLNRW